MPLSKRWIGGSSWGLDSGYGCVSFPLRLMLLPFAFRVCCAFQFVAEGFWGRLNGIDGVSVGASEEEEGRMRLCQAVRGLGFHVVHEWRWNFCGF